MEFLVPYKTLFDQILILLGYERFWYKMIIFRDDLALKMIKKLSGWRRHTWSHNRASSRWGQYLKIYDQMELVVPYKTNCGLLIEHFLE